MMRWVNDPTIDPTIAAGAAELDGEVVELSAEALANWLCTGRAGGTRYYQDTLEQISTALDRTRDQAILVIDEDGRFIIEHPFAGAFNNPPGGCFCRFTMKPAPADARYQLRETGSLS